MSDISEKVSRMIRDARNKSGLTQAELAERLGVARATVNGYEIGKQNLTIGTLQKIATALEIPFDIILG
jgi:HTH-type transcriptional regulator/antitoxin HipB